MYVLLGGERAKGVPSCWKPPDCARASSLLLPVLLLGAAAAPLRPLLLRVRACGGCAVWLGAMLACARASARAGSFCWHTTLSSARMVRVLRCGGGARSGEFHACMRGGACGNAPGQRCVAACPTSLWWERVWLAATGGGGVGWEEGGASCVPAPRRGRACSTTRARVQHCSGGPQ